MSGLVAADIKRATGIPFVITFHALGKVRRLHQGGADGFSDERFAIEDRIVREADQVIAECPQDEEDLIRLYDADVERLTIVPAGFDPTEFWPIDKARARRKLGLKLAKDERVVLQLGRMVPRKGVETALLGFAKLVREHGVRAKLLIVGGESRDPDPKATPEIGRLMAIAESEGVADRVIFTGARRREELRYYYAPRMSSSARPGTSRSASRRWRRWLAARRSSARTWAGSSSRCATARRATSCRRGTRTRWPSAWRSCSSTRR